MRAKQAQSQMTSQSPLGTWLTSIEGAIGTLSRQGVLRTYILWFAAALLIGLLSWQGHKLLAVFDHPIERIEVQGQFENLDEASLQQTLSAWINTSFMAANLAEIKSNVEALPWVRSATVHRVWPGQIVLQINEQTAVANWGDQAYLNAEGEIFAPKQISWNQERPRLVAEAELDQAQRKEMLDMISEINMRLNKDGLWANQLMLDPRGAWQLGLYNGPNIILGTEPFDERLHRATKVFTQLQNDAQLLVEKIDARYPNGVAVRWKDIALASSDVSKKK